MTTTQPANSHPSKRSVGMRRLTRRAGIRRMTPGIDMTPMVDLGFLLIAFFVVSAELTKPTALYLAMPKDGPPMPLAESDALSVLLGARGRLYYYHGDWDPASTAGLIRQTDFSPPGLRKIIRETQYVLDKSTRPEGRDGLMLLIKAAPGASYKNVVDVLDEITIARVKKYAIVKPGADELHWMMEKSD